MRFQSPISTILSAGALFLSFAANASTTIPALVCDPVDPTNAPISRIAVAAEPPTIQNPNPAITIPESASAEAWVRMQFEEKDPHLEFKATATKMEVADRDRFSIFFVFEMRDGNGEYTGSRLTLRPATGMRETVLFQAVYASPELSRPVEMACEAYPVMNPGPGVSGHN